MAELSRGTVTMVFTDIEGSTRLLAFLGSRYEEILAAHRRLVREAFPSLAGSRSTRASPAQVANRFICRHSLIERRSGSCIVALSAGDNAQAPQGALTLV